MRRHVKLVQAKAQQFDRERQELQQRRERAKASVVRLARQVREAAGSAGETAVEKGFRLAALREHHRSQLYSLVALADEFPDLAPYVDDALRAEGIAPPSRPQSARSSVSSIASARD